MASQELFYYPGFTKKAITFTNDDANFLLDGKFIEIVKPHGILGTFNLTAKNFKDKDAEELRRLYSGYEVANHTLTHPYLMNDEQYLRATEEEFDPERASKELVYKIGDGRYRVFRARWSEAVSAEEYKREVEAGHREIERVFGEGSCRSFVWPYFMQTDGEIFEYIKDSFGYYGVRTVGTLRDTTGFNLPNDRTRWSYNATDEDLLSVAEQYERYPDDGRLKFFCFGLHSHDYENRGTWGDLRRFAEQYGNRSADYWYATVGDIFEYEDAVNAAEERGGMITNRSEIPLYMIVSGEKIVLNPGSCVAL